MSYESYQNLSTDLPNQEKLFMKRFTKLSDLCARGLAVIAIVVLVGNCASAGPLFWNLQGGGDGSWGLAIRNWTSPESDDPVAWVAGGDAWFDGSQGTVTIDFGFIPAVGSLQFPSSSGYVITGSSLTMKGSSVVVAPGLSATIDSAIGGTVGVAFSGGGMLTLSGANYYTGRSVVQAGVLELGTFAQDPVLIGNGADIRHGKIVLDYTTTAPDVLTPLTASYNSAGHWTAGRFLCPTKDATHGLGWSDDTANKKVAVSYTLYGDANLDYTVDGSDLNVVLSNYNLTSTVWSQGDFNYDGTVDGADLNVVLSNYNQHLSVGTAVPEPSTLLLAVAGLVGVAACAWSKRK
jgi:autotransporter-associated beta strand protein